MRFKHVVSASEIRLYAYCPRLYFFNVHVGTRRSLGELARLTLGRLAHIVYGIIARLRGYKAEELVEADLGTVIVRGRPDYYTTRGKITFIVELKTGKGPRVGAWISDILQVAAYALILARRGDGGRIVGIIRYRGSMHVFNVRSEHIALLLRVIDEIKLVKEYGIVPYPLRNPRKCSKCAYRVECFLADRGLSEDLEEPGAWLNSIRLRP